MDFTVIFVALLVVVFVVAVIAAASRIKTCPSDQILVKYGQVGGARMAKAIHGGTTFIWPVVQGFRFLDLTPMTVDIDLRGALSKQNIRVNVPSRFTFGIGTVEELMNNAAERLLSLDNPQIEDTAKDIIYGQLRATIAMMDIEEINGDREKFESRVLENIESELMKIGLRLINVNISDITDESGYIEALGQRAAAEAINKAKVDVAQQERDGAVGSAQAEQDQRVRVAEANAQAVTGENQAKAMEAASQADLREAEAEARRRGDAAEAVKHAAADQEGFHAEREAEVARAERDRARGIRQHRRPSRDRTRPHPHRSGRREAARSARRRSRRRSHPRQARRRSGRPNGSPHQDGGGFPRDRRSRRRRPRQSGTPDDRRQDRRHRRRPSQRHQQHRLRQGGGL